MQAQVYRWGPLVALAAGLWVARGMLPPFVIAGVLAYLLAPLADEVAERTRLARRWASLLIFLAVLATVILVGWLLGARLLAEIRGLSAQGPSIVEAIADRLTGGQAVEVMGQSLTSAELARRVNESLADQFGAPSEALHVVRLAVDFGLAAFIFFVALAYFLADGQRLGVFVIRFVPVEQRAHVDRVGREIHRLLGRFLRGQLVLVAVMAGVTFVPLEWGFHLPYALWVALLTGFLEVIPLVGPVTAGAIACALGFSQGGITEAGWLALMYLVLRQVEDQLIMPLIVGRAVHLHPLATIFAVLAGERIAGILGMVLAVPVAAAAKVILDYVYPPAEAVHERQGSPVPARPAPLVPAPESRSDR